MNIEQRVQWVENIMEENARLLAENAQLKDIEAANKETIQYWRARVAELEAQLSNNSATVHIIANHPKAYDFCDAEICKKARAALGKE